MTVAPCMGTGWLACPAQAQLSSYMDRRVNLVYTHANTRKATHCYLQPGSAQQSPLRAALRPIYRVATGDGRVIFTNE